MASSFEIEIDGKIYRSTPLNAFQQFHLMRKVAPFASLSVALLTYGVKHMEDISSDEKATKLELLTDLINMANPVLFALSELPNDKAEEIIQLACQNVMRKNGDIWRPVFENGVVNFSDLTLTAILKLTAAGLKNNLGDFFKGMLTKVIE